MKSELEMAEVVLDCGFEAEVIVVDDASIDDTPEYLRSLEPRLDLTSPWAGISAATCATRTYTGASRMRVLSMNPARSLHVYNGIVEAKENATGHLKRTA